MRSKKSLEGYFQIDHRFGMGTVSVPEGQMLEVATLTCGHCHRIVLLHPERTRDRGYCPACDRYLCDTCGAVYSRTLECRNLNVLFDRMQEEAARNLNVKET